MSKEIICVYQDCIMCGKRGKKIKKLIFENGLDVRKVSFASPEGKELCHEAVFKHRISTMPFYTDGEKFGTKLEDFTAKAEKSVKNVTKTPRKTKKKAKKVEEAITEVEDGIDS